MLRGSRRFLFDGTWLPVKALCDIGVAHLVTPYSLIGLAKHDPLNQFGFAYLEIDCDAQMAQEALEYLNLSWDKPLVDLEAELSERFPNNSIWTKGMTHYSMRLVERHGYRNKTIDLGLLEHLRQKFRHLEDGAGTEPDGDKQTWRSALDALTRILDPDHPDTIATIAVLTRLYWDKRKPNGPEEEVLNAVFSPDGTRVLTTSHDKTARVWDVSTGAELNVLRWHEDKVKNAVFSPDCTRVLTESWDDTARVWNASTGEPIGDPIFNCDAIVSTQNLQAAVLMVRQCEVIHRWSDGSRIPESNRPVECPSRFTLIEGWNQRFNLSVRGLSDFVPPWINIDSPVAPCFCVKVLPTDPLSFVAGCADGSVRFFRLEGVELPVTH